MNLIKIVENAIWEGLADQVCVDRELYRICDTADHGPLDMSRVAANVVEHLAESKIIESIEALDALPIPTPGHLAGVLIKSTCLVDPENGKYGIGEVYERNTDGTWCMLQDPSGADWGERLVPSKDIPLPAVILYVPSA